MKRKYIWMGTKIKPGTSIFLMNQISTILISLLLICACNNSPSNKTETESNSTAKKIEEKSLIALGGAKQYVEITGESDKNPVLLFIHGGPGWPQTPHLRYFNADLTKSFTVATWDQRGCGISYMNDSTVENLTLDQIVADAYELTQMLKEKFKQKKIFLAGFSWGSAVGLKLALMHPDDYAAYVGISQVVNMKQGMEVTQKWLGEQAKKKNDVATLSILKGLRNGDSGICKNPLDCFVKQYELVTKYGGAIFNPRSDTTVAKAMTQYADYKNYNWDKGFFYSARMLEKDIFSIDFSNVTRIDIPVYFIAGRHDWNIPAVLTAEFIKKLQAPHKEMIWFENSGHGPLEEEPEKFNAVMVEKLIKQK